MEHPAYRARIGALVERDPPDLDLDGRVLNHSDARGRVTEISLEVGHVQPHPHEFLNLSWEGVIIVVFCL